MTWRSIRRKQDLIITDWRQWARHGNYERNAVVKNQGTRGFSRRDYTVSGQSVRSRPAGQGVSHGWGRALTWAQAWRCALTVHRRPAMQGMAFLKLEEGLHLEYEAWPHTLADEAWLRGRMTNVVLGLCLVRPSRQEPCVWRATQGLRRNSMARTGSLSVGALWAAGTVGVFFFFPARPTRRGLGWCDRIWRCLANLRAENKFHTPSEVDVTLLVVCVVSHTHAAEHLQQRGQRILEDCWQWEANGQCSTGDNCSFRHDVNKRAKMTQPNPSPKSFMQQSERKTSRTRSPRGKSPSGRMFRWPCKDNLKGTCTNSFCEKWHPPECLFYKTKSVCRFGTSACMHIVRLMNNLVKGPKRVMTKVQLPCWRSMSCMIERGDPLCATHQIHDNWVAYSRTWSRRSLFSGGASTCRDQSNVWSSQRLLHVTPKFETKILRSDIFAQVNLISADAPKFEDRSLEETEWQEQGAREAAWKLAKSVLKLKEHERATFFSLSENRCLPASSLKPEEREFVVDSGASMHMISKKNLSDAEMDTLTKSCSPTIVITANGEVQTHEEATVCVKELDISLTMKVLENTPAALSLGKLCDENGYSYEWINGQKPHLIKNGIGVQCNTENFVPLVVPGLSSSSSGSSSTSKTPSKQESHSSSSSSSSSSSPSVSEIQIREREDGNNSDISSVLVSNSVDDRSGQPDETTVEWGNSLNSEIPEWLQEFRENLVDDEIPVHGGSHASSSHEASLEPIFRRREDLGKHSIYTHFPKDRNCEICKRTKITRAPCRRRNGEAVPRDEKFRWLDNSRPQGPQWQLRISKQSPIRCRGAGPSHPMDPSVSVQNQNFTRNPEKLAKVPGTREES